MSYHRDKILPQLLQLGLEEDESRVYLHLLEDSPKSVLELSRELSLGRNVIYRQIERLTEKELIKEVKSSSGLKVSAESYRKLELQIQRKEQELRNIQSSATDLFGSLAQLASSGENGTLNYYSGPEGIRQITLNSLSARKEVLLLEIASLSAILPLEEAERIRAEFAKRQILTRQLTNAKSMEPWTNVEEQIRHYWQPRYISPDHLSIDFEVLIYNDTVAMYTFLEDHAWGLEVVSPALTTMQKQLFEFIWNQAKKMKILDNHGKASI